MGNLIRKIAKHILMYKFIQTDSWEILLKEIHVILLLSLPKRQSSYVHVVEMKSIG